MITGFKTMLKHMILILGTSVTVITQEPCPSGGIQANTWREYKGNEYLYNASLSTWKDAEFSCRQNHDTHLASVHSEEDIQFISACMLAVNENQHDVFAWLGYTTVLNQADSSRWTDGSSVDFADDYLKNAIHANDTNTCGAVSTKQRIFYLQCDMLRGFVCRKIACPAEFKLYNHSWLPFEGKLYFYAEHNYTWSEAAKLCSSYPDSLLTSVHSLREMLFLKQCLVSPYYPIYNYNHYFWTGYKAPAYSGDQGTWLDGSSVAYVEEHFRSGNNTYSSCLMLSSHPLGTKFVFVICRTIAGIGATLGVVCQKPADDLKSSCPIVSSNTSEWIEIEGKGYQYVQKSVDWTEAERSCVGSGGHLASIQTTKKLNYLSKCLVLPHLLEEDDLFFWVGYLSPNIKSAYGRWTDATATVFADELFFNDSQAIRIHASSCGRVSAKTARLTFVHCDDLLLGFVCQKQKDECGFGANSHVSKSSTEPIINGTFFIVHIAPCLSPGDKKRRLVSLEFYAKKASTDELFRLLIFTKSGHDECKFELKANMRIGHVSPGKNSVDVNYVLEPGDHVGFMQNGSLIESYDDPQQMSSYCYTEEQVIMHQSKQMQKYMLRQFMFRVIFDYMTCSPTLGENIMQVSPDVSKEYAYGTELIFSCKNNHDYVTSRTCNADGRLSGPEIVCNSSDVTHHSGQASSSTGLVVTTTTPSGIRDNMSVSVETVVNIAVTNELISITGFLDTLLELLIDLASLLELAQQPPLPGETDYRSKRGVNATLASFKSLIKHIESLNFRLSNVQEVDMDAIMSDMANVLSNLTAIQEQVTILEKEPYINETLFLEIQSLLTETSKDVATAQVRINEYKQISTGSCYLSGCGDVGNAVDNYDLVDSEQSGILVDTGSPFASDGNVTGIQYYAQPGSEGKTIFVALLHPLGDTVCGQFKVIKLKADTVKAGVNIVLFSPAVAVQLGDVYGFSWLDNGVVSYESIALYDPENICYCQGDNEVGGSGVLNGDATSDTIITLTRQNTYRKYAIQVCFTAVATPQPVIEDLISGSDVHIECIRNCWENRNINPSERLSLSFVTSMCSRCKHNSSLTYLWQLNVSDPRLKKEIIWDKETTTGNDKANIVINKDVFSGSVHVIKYSLNLTVQLSTLVKGKETTISLGWANYEFTVNRPPRGGGCNVDPMEGVTFDTKFSINCSGFIDDDEPLTYIYKAVINHKPVILHYSEASYTPPVNIPMGEFKNDYLVKIEVIVSDSRGASTTAFTSVKVRPDNRTTDRMEKLTLGKDSLLSSLVRTDHTKQALTLITEAVTVLNERSTVNEMEATKQVELRENLLDQLVSLQVKSSITSVQQTATVLKEVTRGRKDHVNDTTQKMASEYLLKLSSTLNEVEATDESAEQLYDTGVDVVESVSNVLSSIGYQYRKTELDIMQKNETHSDDFKQYTETVRNMTMASLSAIEKVKMVMAKIAVPFEKATVVVSDMFSLSVQKSHGDYIPCSVDAQFSLPCSLPMPTNDDSEYSVETVYFNENPYFWADKEVNSSVISLDIKSNKSEPLKFHNLSDPVMITLALNTTMEFQHLNLTNHKPAYITMKNIKGDEAPYVVVRTNVNTTSSPIELYIHGNEAARWAFTTTKEEQELLIKDALRDPIPQHHTGLYGTYDAILPNGEAFYLVILMLNSSQYDTLHVELMTTRLRCLYWDSHDWSTKGCVPHSVHALAEVKCACNHFSSFASSLLVAPNPINYADVAQFLTFWNNPIGVIAVCLLLVLYIPATIWARRRDKQRNETRKAIDLADNDPYDKYRYIVILETGSTAKQVLSSDLCIIMQGTVERSEPHALLCSSHPVFQPGTVNFFVVRTPCSLGEIESITLWLHNTKGNYPHWFASMCLVYDPQENQKWAFQCGCWLSPDKGGEDASTKKTFSAVDRTVDHNMLYRNAMFDLKENHLYLSIFKSSAEINFTLCQRVACCLCVLMLDMLTNIMFYKVEPDPSAYVFEWGEFSYNTHNLMISVESALILVPATMAVTKLFQVSRPRHPAYIIKESLELPTQYKAANKRRSSIEVLRQSFAKFQQTSIDILQQRRENKNMLEQVSDNTPVLERLGSIINVEAFRRWYKVKKGNYNVMSEVSLNSKVNLASESEKSITKSAAKEKKLPKRQSKPLPWWCTYIAWVLVFLISGVCSFYTILYTFNFGYDKSVSWLTSVLVTEVIDIFALTPLKIVVFALFASCVFRKYYIEELEELDEIMAIAQGESGDVQASDHGAADAASDVDGEDNDYVQAMRTIAANKRKSLVVDADEEVMLEVKNLDTIEERSSAENL